jgi:hypothetical protein
MKSSSSAVKRGNELKRNLSSAGRSFYANVAIKTLINQ